MTGGVAPVWARTSRRSGLECMTYTVPAIMRVPAVDMNSFAYKSCFRRKAIVGTGGGWGTGRDGKRN